MFKNAIIFRIVNTPAVGFFSEDALQAHAFVPCGASQEKSMGWTSPRNQMFGPLMEQVAGQSILSLMIESKQVPADVIKRKVDEQCAHIEATTGRKPGKKEKREISEDAKLALLPHAFSKISTTQVWIDPKNKLLVIDSASQARIDDVVTALVRSIDGLAIQLINTQTSPAAAMSHWLSSQEAPLFFSVDRECELKAADESKAVVRYTRHALDTDEIRQHIAMGKVPTRVAMTWADRISFVLTESMAIKKIELLDILDDQYDEESGSFDANIAIFTGEMAAFIPDLLTGLGGEINLSTTGESK
jgi:recombination associated protein RdgC